MRHLLTFLLGAVAATTATALILRGCSAQNTNPSAADTITLTDTITLCDTIVIATPSHTRETIMRHQTISLPVAPSAPSDTANPIPSDTARVQIPITQKHYQTQNYQAWVSGYQPTLDSLHIYSPTTIITHTNTITQEKIPHSRRWGISAGVGAVVTNRQISPGIFIGLTYTFVTF